MLRKIPPLQRGKVLMTTREVPKHIRKPPYALNKTGWAIESWKAPWAVYDLDSKELKSLRKACRLAARSLNFAESLAKVGVTTEEIDARVHEFICNQGAYPSPLGYLRFPKSICTSVNEVMCHGIPDDRKLMNGDIVNLDVSCYFEGMHGDTSLTVMVGDAVDSEARALVDFTQRCLSECIAMCKPGVPLYAIGDLVSKMCEESRGRYSTNRFFVGHGIGPLFHMQPLIYHFHQETDANQGRVMSKGMAFTIEPIIVEGE